MVLSGATLYVGRVTTSTVPVGIVTFPVNGSSFGFDTESFGLDEVGSPVLGFTSDEVQVVILFSLITHLPTFFLSCDVAISLPGLSGNILKKKSSCPSCSESAKVLT